MRTFLVISIFLFSLSCKNPDNRIADIPQTSLRTEINSRDTCLRILSTYAREDTFLYERFYDERTFIDGRISYVRTGTFIFPDKKSGIIIYTPTDSTVAVELYSFQNGAWALLDREINLPHNGILFYSDFSDYNFDGIHDIYINVTVSNGLGLCTGHLLTITPTGSLVKHPETREIRDMSPDSASKTVNAHKALYCKDNKSVCVEKYQWVNNKLVQTSLPCTCPD